VRQPLAGGSHGLTASRLCARPPHGRRPVRGAPGKAQKRGTELLGMVRRFNFGTLVFFGRFDVVAGFVADVEVLC
jgi:hypothetical protein